LPSPLLCFRPRSQRHSCTIIFRWRNDQAKMRVTKM
jgi:hypothetical protein